MQSKTFSRLSIVFVVIVSFIVLILISRQAADKNPFPIASSTPISDVGRKVVDIKLPRGVIHAIVSSTTDEVELGLSGRASLATDTAMLFVFPTAGKYGFWMKDMNFPIDIVWINSSSSVISVLPQLSPATYPNIFYPNGEVKYVLELNADAAAEYGIATGTVLFFPASAR